MANADILKTLRGEALSTAIALLNAYPGEQLTSGGRPLDDQAHAMAVDEVQEEHAKGDPCWVTETYAGSPVEAAVQAWCSANVTNESTVDQVAAGILGVLQTFSASALRHLSWHLMTKVNPDDPDEVPGSDAFDVDPNSPNHDAVVAFLEAAVAAVIAAGGQGKVLKKEGTLIRTHCQISAA